jgi:hypothetical protein
MQAGRGEMRFRGNRGERFYFTRYQFVYVWQSKFQSIPLCAVDARPPRLLASSLLYEEGVYETKTDFEVDIIGRGGSSAGTALVQLPIACAIRSVSIRNASGNGG